MSIPTQNSLFDQSTALEFAEQAFEADDLDSHLEWLRVNRFNLLTPLIIFNDNFRRYGIAYACIQKRAFFIESGIHKEVVAMLNPESLTFLGQRHHFSFEFFERINSLGVPVSIMTANEEASFVHFLLNSLRNINMTIKAPCVRNFFIDSPKSETADENSYCVKTGDALFLGAHGDILCALLDESILCGKVGGRTLGEGKHLPACALSRECFRKQRLAKEEKARLIGLEELQAKALFLNICGGFSITRTKFGEYPHLLPLKAIEYRAVIYISSYLIKKSSTEEVFLFWALLQSHGTFSKAMFYLNEVCSAVHGTQRPFMMLGDGLVGMAKENNNSCKYEVIYSSAELMLLDVTDLRDGYGFLSLYTADHELLTAKGTAGVIGFLDDFNPAAICLYKDADKINIVLQFFDRKTDRFRLYLYPKDFLQKHVNKIEQRGRLTFIPDTLRLEKESQNALKTAGTNIQELLEKLRLQLCRSDLSATKYLNIRIITQYLSKKLFEFERGLMLSIVESAIENDTHLILNEPNLLGKKGCLPGQKKCYTCGNVLEESIYRKRTGDNVDLIQTVCPLCEIISVRNAELSMLRVFSEKEVEKGSPIGVRLEFSSAHQEEVTAHIGLVLINGNVSSIEESVAFAGRLEYMKEIPTPIDIPSGLYYLRCFLVTGGAISISHKHIHIR